MADHMTRADAIRAWTAAYWDTSGRGGEPNFGSLSEVSRGAIMAAAAIEYASRGRGTMGFYLGGNWKEGG